MDTAWFHIVPLVILTIIAIVGCVLFVVAAIVDWKNNPLPNVLGAAICGVLAIIGLVWWFSSSNEPYEAQFEQFYEIKEVVYPDGCKVQMVNINGVNHDITNIHRKWYESKEWHVRFVIFKRTYNGLSWAGTGNATSDGKWFLQRKDGSMSQLIDTNKK